MKQMTEAQLRQIIEEAYDEGFQNAQEKGPAYDPDEVDCERGEYTDTIMVEL